jgi:hypothetical protein
VTLPASAKLADYGAAQPVATVSAWNYIDEVGGKAAECTGLLGSTLCGLLHRSTLYESEHIT